MGKSKNFIEDEFVSQHSIFSIFRTFFSKTFQDKLIKIMRVNRAIKQQQLSSMRKNTEQTEKELQLLDERTNELVQRFFLLYASIALIMYF